MIIKGKTIKGLKKAVLRKMEDMKGKGLVPLVSHPYLNENGKLYYCEIVPRAKNHTDGEWGFPEMPTYANDWFFFQGIPIRYRDDIRKPVPNYRWGTDSVVENIWGEKFVFDEKNTGQKCLRKFEG